MACAGPAPKPKCVLGPNECPLTQIISIQRKDKGKDERRTIQFIHLAKRTNEFKKRTDGQKLTNLSANSKTMFGHFASSSSSTDCDSNLALSPPLFPCPSCQCRRLPSLARTLSSLNLLPMLLLLTLSVFLLASPSVCSASPQFPMSAGIGDSPPSLQYVASSSASASLSSSEESARKSPMGEEKADDWEEEEDTKLKQDQNQMKKNPHRMVVKRQMKRAVEAMEAAEDEKLVEEEQEEQQQSCTVRVQVVKKVKGKCVRLHGGQSACQSADYLDPVNEDCMFS
ncbi:hypothetical protein niasHT_039801 [Heterodera trifolii]|uniref:Uncharacterized protein n=1 Tax=Heterodera trifolii TaxID=157864 RepID=A0ABD2IML9_9BILA